MSDFLDLLDVWFWGDHVGAAQEFFLMNLIEEHPGMRSIVFLFRATASSGQPQGLPLRAAWDGGGLGFWNRPFGYAQGRLFGDVVLLTPGEPWG